MTAQTDIKLSLQVTQGPGLEAVLHNGSAAEMKVLVNENLQPVQLILEDATGAVVKPFDERTRRKYDRRVSAGMYAKIASQSKITLTRAQFREAAAGEYELLFGPYRFRNLRPGLYKAHAIFESKIDEKTEGVWKGTARSDRVELNLP